MDHDRMENVKADTAMREAIAGPDTANGVDGTNVPPVALGPGPGPRPSRPKAALP
jgi:hypothetical protein